MIVSAGQLLRQIVADVACAFSRGASAVALLAVVVGGSQTGCASIREADEARAQCRTLEGRVAELRSDCEQQRAQVAELRSECEKQRSRATAAKDDILTLTKAFDQIQKSWMELRYCEATRELIKEDIRRRVRKLDREVVTNPALGSLPSGITLGRPSMPVPPSLFGPDVRWNLRYLTVKGKDDPELEVALSRLQTMNENGLAPVAVMMRQLEKISPPKPDELLRATSEEKALLDYAENKVTDAAGNLRLSLESAAPSFGKIQLKQIFR